MQSKKLNRVFWIVLKTRYNAIHSKSDTGLVLMMGTQLNEE
jgi:hypothetical protein